MLANLIGRKWSMVLVAAGYAVFALLGAMSGSVPMLLVARLLLGLTIGVSVVVVPVFVAESAPAEVRGSLLVGYQVATVVGIIVGYLAGYLLADSREWRWMLALAAVPANWLTLLLLRMPDTARWYMFKGRVAEARRALQQVEPDSDVERELAEISAALAEESGGRFLEMLRRPYLRATVFVIALGFFIQITGINAIVYYSPRLFDAMGFRGNFALLVLPAMVQAAALAAVLVVGGSGRPAGSAPGSAVRHRHNDRRRRGARSWCSPRTPQRCSASSACCCSPWASPSASARWYGCTPARASRPGYGRWARARC